MDTNQAAPIWSTFTTLPRVFGAPWLQARLRQRPEDFQVEELLDFAPSGEGEHVYLHLRKRDTNTRWLADRIAELAGVPPEQVGYAGLKDRRAVACQWFSVPLPPAREPDWERLAGVDLELLTVTRHERKLRQRDALSGNRFAIRLQQAGGDPAGLEERLETIRRRGVPNYFGAQRFGIDDGNLRQATRMLLRDRHGPRPDRFYRGLYLSAVRSQLFNEVLAWRVREGNWDCPLPGDILMDAAGELIPLVEVPGADILEGVACLQVHPTGPLWGRGRSPAKARALELEELALAGFPQWRYGLEHVGLSQERRPLRVGVPDLAGIWEGEQTLLLTFTLPPGHFATAVLREICVEPDTDLDADA
jgi:tRNA pseudouridine13 synthase